MAVESPTQALIEQLFNILLVLTAMLLVLTLVLSSRPARREKPVLRTRIECLSCGYIVEREYRRGDYVGKEEGTCPKCGSPMVVTAVYEVRRGERREEERLVRLVEKRGQQSASRGTRSSG